MEVIIYLPDTAETGEELKRTVTRVQAELAAGFIHNLSCSDQQKCEIMKSIITEGYRYISSQSENHKTLT